MKSTSSISKNLFWVGVAGTMFVLVIVSSFFLFKKKEPLDLTKEENWIKVFPNAYPQVDDITPVPGPFEPYRKDGLYTLIEISPLVRFLQLNSGKLQSFACLSLDVTHGEAVVKFLFDRNYYSMQVKRRHGDHYNFVNGSETLGFKLEPDIVFDDGSIGYMIRYEDERYLRGEHYYDNLKTNSGTNSSSHYKNMTECIVSVLEQSVSLNKNSLIEN